MSNIIRRISNALFEEEEEECIYERHWSHNANHDDHQHDTNEHWVRPFLFGDSHADTHHFTESAMKRAPKEIACAAAASAMVSPLVSIVDRCLVKRTGFAQAATEATRTMVSNPRVFFGGLGFRLTFAVYFGTYAVANLSELALDAKKRKNEETRKTTKVAATGLANVGLLVWRDSMFARAYTNSAAVTGHGAPTGPKVPLRSMKLFAARDMGTMYATFYLAPQAAEYLAKERNWDRNAAELSMALTIPAAMQAVTAPLHIHAMDFYANMHVKTFQERFDVILRDWKTVAFARGFRILPAFGLGSFTNNKFREAFIRHEDFAVEGVEEEEREEEEVVLEDGRRAIPLRRRLSHMTIANPGEVPRGQRQPINRRVSGMSMSAMSGDANASAAAAAAAPPKPPSRRVSGMSMGAISGGTTSPMLAASPKKQAAAATAAAANDNESKKQ